MLIDEGLELLDEDEAWRLVLPGGVGRVGVTIGPLPAIFPVNYVVVDGAIAFRTSPGTKLSAATARATVAFEVDDFDLVARTGWSVLVVGPSERVLDAKFSDALRVAGLAPMAAGARVDLVRIRPELITGRRLVHAAVL